MSSSFSTQTNHLSPRRWLGLAVFSLTCALLALAPGSSLAVPAGRAYEMVSPVYTAGYGVLALEDVAVDGESVAYYSAGTFAGAPDGLSGLDTLVYLARRGGTGWSTAPIVPPATLMPSIDGRDVSPTLDSTLAFGLSGPSFEVASIAGTVEQFMSHATGAPDESADWELMGMSLEGLHEEHLEAPYVGASDDFCHLFFLTKVSLIEGVLPPLDQRPYELNRGCHGEPVGIRLVAEGHGGQEISPACTAHIGSAPADIDTFNAISADGSEVFFSSCATTTDSSTQLFVRLGGAKTIEVSKPIDPSLETCGESEIPCKDAATRPSARLAGASEDGSKAYLMTAAQLVSEDTDGANDLYLAKIGCPPAEAECAPAGRRVTSLTQVSHDAVAGQAADVQGVVKVAPDGRRVYFVARGVLGEGPNEEGITPIAGADNLYVYDSESERTAFIADLCSGYLQSGAVEDSHCPKKGSNSDTNLWLASNGWEVQTAGADGEFLVFSSFGQLTGDDTDASRDIYRYDAQTGTLERVSLGEGGHDANGNCPEGGEAICDATLNNEFMGNTVALRHRMHLRAIAEDGSRIVFSSAEQLSAGAVKGIPSAYEWRQAAGQSEGVVSLLSGGDAPAESPVITPSGRDVFFITTQQLTGQSVGGLPALYDVRLGGGFPQPPVPPEPCDSDACQGPLTNPAPLLVPGSVAQAPGENAPTPKSKTVVKKVKPKKKSKKKIRSKGRKSDAKQGVGARVARGSRSGRRR